MPEMLMIDLQTYLAHPEKLDRDSLEALRGVLARFPYYQAARLLYLKNLRVLGDPVFEQELCRSVVYITHRAFLYHFLEGDLRLPVKSSGTSAEEASAGDRTLAIIDAYLSSMPEESTYAAIGSGIATDYASYLLRGEVSSDEPAAASPMRGQRLIDDFIEKADAGYAFSKVHDETDTSAAAADEDAESDDDSYFTETLAKIYIKQQRYAKAIEIIKKLSLKYPKKSTYFANQIKQLEELIINAKSKQ